MLVLASRLVPAGTRADWQGGWETRLTTWWLLVDRGELIYRGFADAARVCRMIAGHALWERFNRESLGLFVRGPAFLLFALAAGALAMAAVTGGFSGTRALLHLVHTARAGPFPDGHHDLLAGYTILLAFAIATALLITIVSRPPLRLCPSRYAILFVLKTLAALALLTAGFFEVGATVRRLMPPGPARALLNGLVGGLVFVALFARVTLWSFADQRARCPVCLHRLALPVTIGSWASVLDPVTTEILCLGGHGSLCISESGSGQPDRWTALDASWAELFQHPPAAPRA